MYLLDTNYCSRIIRGDAERTARFQELSNLEVVTSVIVRGELVFMAENSEQRAANLARVEIFFQDIGVYPINGATTNIYGQPRQVSSSTSAHKRRVSVAGSRLLN
jgi:tRNA(fMet)-specific endonuclease VapC